MGGGAIGQGGLYRQLFGSYGPHLSLARPLLRSQASRNNQFTPPDSPRRRKSIVKLSCVGQCELAISIRTTITCIITTEWAENSVECATGWLLWRLYILYNPISDPGPHWGAYDAPPDPEVGWGGGYPFPISTPVDAAFGTHWPAHFSDASAAYVHNLPGDGCMEVTELVGGSSYCAGWSLIWQRLQSRFKPLQRQL